MPSETIDRSILEIIDATDDGSEADPRIKRLKGLLKTIRINRYAIPIALALEGGDRGKAAQIAVEAKKNGIDVDELKAAVRAQKSWKK